MGTLRDRLQLGGLIDLASLFAGRIGGILVTLLFIPQYNRLLGADVFGAVSVVLSLQAFFLVSDLGLATLISRDTAIARSDADALAQAVWMRRRAELLLGLLAVCVAAPALLLPLLVGGLAPWSFAGGLNAAMISGLVTALVSINIVQLCLNAIGRYRQSALTSVLGALLRGGLAVLALQMAPTLPAFLAAQTAIALLHFGVVRQLLERACGLVPRPPKLLEREAIRELLRRCIPLTIYTLASAAAVNLDKSIISAFVSLEAAGRYFLATTYAMVPVAVLSGPLNSYFAPRVTHALHADDPVAERRIATLFQTVLMFAVVGPSLGLGFQMEAWLRLWLADSSGIAQVMQVAPILLAGGALSATGYYPTTYLIAAGDNRFLAKLSSVCGTAVLLLATIFASHGNLQGFAWCYFAFYAAGFVGLWGRMATLKGIEKTGSFLLHNYLLPGALMGAGYAFGLVLVDDNSYHIASMLLPMLMAGAVGAVILSIVILRPYRRVSIFP